MDTEFAEIALASPNLYQEIVRHRSRLNRINGMDYKQHAPKYINPIPPENVLKTWEGLQDHAGTNDIWGLSSFQGNN